MVYQLIIPQRAASIVCNKKSLAGRKHALDVDVTFREDESRIRRDTGALARLSTESHTQPVKSTSVKSSRTVSTTEEVLKVKLSLRILALKKE